MVQRQLKIRLRYSFQCVKGEIDSTSEAYETFAKNQLVSAGVGAYETSLRGRPMLRRSHISRVRVKRGAYRDRAGGGPEGLWPPLFWLIKSLIVSCKYSKQCSMREILFFWSDTENVATLDDDTNKI